jgi:hypothetical protein
MIPAGNQECSHTKNDLKTARSTARRLISGFEIGMLDFIFEQRRAFGEQIFGYVESLLFLANQNADSLALQGSDLVSISLSCFQGSCFDLLNESF